MFGPVADEAGGHRRSPVPVLLASERKYTQSATNLYGGAIDITPTSDERPAPLTADEEALLRALSRVIYALPKAIEADLEREARMSLSEYMTLVHLSEAPCRALRMSELAEAASLSLSGMTHIVSRLQDQGLVARVRCQGDGRGWNAVLTDTGLARLSDAWPTNVTSVRRHLLDHLGGIDLGSLAKAFGDVAGSGPHRT